MREPMRETGLPQTLESTTIYCDNTAATQIMESKGTIGKRSKAMDAQNPCAQKKPRVMMGKDLRKNKSYVGEGPQKNQELWWGKTSEKPKIMGETQKKKRN
jgi:hypothetical protein